MDLSLLSLTCGHLGFSCMKLSHMERFLIQVWTHDYTIALYLCFSVKRQRNYPGKELASDSSNTGDLGNVLQVMVVFWKATITVCVSHVPRGDKF